MFRDNMERVRRRRWHCISGILIGSALLLGTVPAHAVFDFVAPNWDSMTAFLKLAREQLGAQRVVLGAQLDWEKLTPADGVLILHPEAAVEFTEASAFMSAGGRLAVVDDYGKGDVLLHRFHIQRIPSPVDPLDRHLGKAELAIARPTTAPAPGGYTKHTIVRDVDRVITNHPMALRTSSDVELTPVLEFPTISGKPCLLAMIGVIGNARACGLVEDGGSAIAGERCGRLFAMADPSVFINLMMNFKGNRDLAAGLVQYLVEDDIWGQRSGKLYILANDFHQTGHFGGKTNLHREVEGLLETLENWLADLQKEGLPKRLALALAASAAIAVAAWGYKSSGQLYERPTPRYARRLSLLQQGGAAGRAAVLSAPTTRASLVMLELKAAAEEYLREALDLEATASPKEILVQLKRRGALDPRQLKILEQGFAELRRAEEALVGPANSRISPQAIERMHKTLQEILPRVRRSPRGIA